MVISGSKESPCEQSKIRIPTVCPEGNAARNIIRTYHARA